MEDKKPDKKSETGRNRIRGIMLAALAAVLFVFVLWSVPLPYYFMEPGQPVDAAQVVQVEGGLEHPGRIYITTVIDQRANVALYIYHFFRPESQLVPLKKPGAPPVRTQGEIEDPYQVQLEESTYRAKLFALREMGYDVPLRFGGAQVTAHLPNSSSRDVLLPGDVIIEVDGSPVHRQEDIHRYLNRSMSDKKMTYQVTFTRDGKKVTRVIRAIRDHAGRASLGTYFQTRLLRVKLPVNITSSPRGFSGPSAGLAMFLEIIRQMKREDVTGGMKIAATGTISRMGRLRPVIGVKYKVKGALGTGSKVFMCPPGEF